MVCSFLLQLSLLDLECSAFTPSMLAAAGLSVACEVFGKETWPASLQQYSAYTVKDLQPCRDRQVTLATLQGVQFIAHTASSYSKLEDTLGDRDLPVPISCCTGMGQRLTVGVCTVQLSEAAGLVTANSAGGT